MSEDTPSTPPVIAHLGTPEKAKGAVVIPASFQISSDRLKELREVGGIFHDDTDFDHLAIPEPEYGETTIGYLTPEEATLFVTMYVCNDEVEKLGRQLAGATIQRVGARMGEDIQKGGDGKLDPSQIAADADPELVKAYYRNVRIMNYAHSTLFAMLDNRFDAWDWLLGVRSKRRVVKVSRRF